MDQLIFASLSHSHYWYEVGMLKVPAVLYASMNHEKEKVHHKKRSKCPSAPSPLFKTERKNCRGEDTYERIIGCSTEGGPHTHRLSLLAMNDDRENETTGAVAHRCLEGHTTPEKDAPVRVNSSKLNEPVRNELAVDRRYG